MNLRTYFVAVWQGIAGKTELKKASELAEESGVVMGKALGTAWTSGVCTGFDEALSQSLPLLLGNESEAEELIDEAEVVAKAVDFSRMTKKQLQKYANQNEIVIDGRWSTETIREALAAYEA